MNIPFSKFRKSASLLSLSIIIFVFVFSGFFTSCSQNTPELSQSDYSIIFDYSDEDTLPEARLSLFMASVSDVRRYERIRITSLDTGYIWDTQDICRIQSDNLQWAGCTNIVAPEKEKLPVGKYEITYFNADEKEASITLEIIYDTDFYDILFSALPDVMAEKKGIEKIAIYDKDKILLYFGDREERLNTTRGIWNLYRDADTYQIIWYSIDGTVICIGPEKSVTPEEEN